MQSDPPRLRTGAVISFVVTALVSSVLLISVVVILLGDLLGSHLLSMTILGVVIGGASWLIYAKALSPVFSTIERQIYSIQQLLNLASRICRGAVESIISRLFET